jgi:general secretion pathway protein D
VISNHAVSREEAVGILHKALSEHQYAANVEGNILNIFVVDSSNSEIIAGVTDNNYTNVPPTREVVTQIVYVRNVEASTLISSLQSLMPSGSSMTANQGANAIVITDTKANIRRMVQLVRALDTPSVSPAGVEVFALQYADAKALAEVVTGLFQSGDTSASRDSSRGGRFGFFGGFGGGGGGNTSPTTPAGRVTAPKVTAVADERSNSLVVSAAEDQMPLVRAIVQQMDVDVEAVSELKVFRLQNADPQETADQITSLFTDTTAQQNQRNSRFGPFGPFGGNTQGSTTATQSDRRKSESRVTAVADPRTQSVIVSASADNMKSIAGIIAELDTDPSRKKKVHVIKVENRDPQELVQDLQAVISQDTSAGSLGTSRGSSQSGSQLNTRQQNNTRNQGQQTTSGFNTGGGTRTGR